MFLLAAEGYYGLHFKHIVKKENMHLKKTKKNWEMLPTHSIHSIQLIDAEKEVSD